MLDWHSHDEQVSMRDTIWSLFNALLLDLSNLFTF
jgi:hypothetical protein